MPQQRCTCYQTMRLVSRLGFVVEHRPNPDTVEPADLDVVCRDCGAVYRLIPIKTARQCPAGQLVML